MVGPDILALRLSARDRPAGLRAKVLALVALEKCRKRLLGLLFMPADSNELLFGLGSVAIAGLTQQVEQAALPLDMATDLESQVGPLGDSGSGHDVSILPTSAPH